MPSLFSFCTCLRVPSLWFSSYFTGKSLPISVVVLSSIFIQSLIGTFCSLNFTTHGFQIFISITGRVTDHPDQNLFSEQTSPFSHLAKTYFVPK